MPNPVITADVEARFRPLSAAEESVAQALIDDAWVILQSRRPGLELAMALGDVTPDVVRVVLVTMVLRVLRNPDGIRQWSVDDATFIRDNTLSTGGLYVADAELALLAVSTGGGNGGAFTIRPGAAPAL